MRGERVWNTVTRRSMPLGRAPDGMGYRSRAFDDGILVVCFLVLVGVAVLGGLLTLFYWVAATLPPSLLLACPEFDGCAAPASDEDQAVQVHGSRSEEPRIAP
jgi:hypothetical protein